jgi:phosphate transport system substrate-binding protein
LKLFDEKFGYRPTAVVVALDCLAVFVHEDNPIRGLTIPQVDCIFSATRNSGYRNITTWGGAMSPKDRKRYPKWVDRPIHLYGRNSVSGTYGFFKKHALFKGDFKETVKELPASVLVVNAVAGDQNGIGYSGIGYLRPGIRAIPLSPDHNTPLVEPKYENVVGGTYPLGRRLYIYAMKKPDGLLPLLEREFLKFVLSKEGQEIVLKDGFGPLPAAVAKIELEKIR